MPAWWTGQRSSALSSDAVNSTASTTLDPSHLQRMLSSAHVECELEDNRPVRLRNAAGLRLDCVEGIAWITFHGEAEDLMLHAGQATVVPNDGLVLMEAVGRGRIRIALERKIAGKRAGSVADAFLPRLHGLLFMRAIPD